MKEISHLDKELIYQPLQMTILAPSMRSLDFVINLEKLKGKVVRNKKCVDYVDNMCILILEIRCS